MRKFRKRSIDEQIVIALKIKVCYFVARTKQLWIMLKYFSIRIFENGFVSKLENAKYDD
jgi:hypothetical protein